MLKIKRMSVSFEPSCRHAAYAEWRSADDGVAVLQRIAFELVRLRGIARLQAGLDPMPTFRRELKLTEGLKRSRCSILRSFHSSVAETLMVMTDQNSRFTAVLDQCTRIETTISLGALIRGKIKFFKKNDSQNWYIWEIGLTSEGFLAESSLEGQMTTSEDKAA